MNLKQLIETDQPIYVKNASKKATGKDLLIMLNFKDAQGNNRPVKLPSMKYPVDISRMVAPRQLLGESTDFLRLLSNGILELIPQEKAEQMLGLPGAQAAVAREYDKRKQGMTASGGKDRFGLRVRGSSVQDQQLPETEGLEDFEARMMRPPIPKEYQDELPNVIGDFEVVNDQGAFMLQAKSDGIDPRIAQLMATLIEDAGSKGEVLQDLQIMDEEAISDEDLGYVMEKSRNFPPIVSWAKKILASRQPTSPTKPRRRRRKVKGA